MSEPLAFVEGKAAFAKRLGVSPSRVTALAKEGLPLDELGRVRVADALRWIESRQNPVRSAAGRLTGAIRHDATEDADADDDAPPPDADDDTAGRYWKAKADREEHNAELARLKVAQLRGELLDAATVKADTFRLAKGFRDGLLSFPARSAPVIAAALGISDTAALAIELEREVRAHLAHAAGGEQ